MAGDFEQVQAVNTSDQLGFALFVALAAHALLVFGIGFGLELRQPPPPTLEVTLAQHKSQQTPEQADYLAQFDQQSSGDQADKAELTTDRLAELPAPTTREAMPIETALPQQRQADRTALITTNGHSRRRASANTSAEHSPGQQQRNIDATPVQELASLRAKLDQQRQEYSRIPRVNRLTAASTRSADEANYMRYWVERIEQTGNSHYPSQASRQRLYGELRLAVTLMPDGSVAGIEILQSSGTRVLDQAAVRIVRQATPFKAFPQPLRDWDQLEIIRTWRFEPGDRLNTE